MVNARDLDLALFQFDWELTFAVFFLNPDKTIYGRYGSRSDFEQAERDISLSGLQKAMSAALQLHSCYPANKSSLAAKSGPEPKYRRLTEYPFVSQRRPAAGHNIWLRPQAALREVKQRIQTSLSNPVAPHVH